MIVLRLKEILNEKGITGKELSTKVNVTQASISNIVQGNSFPKPELLVKIANTLDVDIRELFIPTKEISKEYEIVNYDIFEKSLQEDFINMKSKKGLDLVTSTYYVDSDGVKSFRMYFKKRK